MIEEILGWQRGLLFSEEKEIENFFGVNMLY